MPHLVPEVVAHRSRGYQRQHNVPPPVVTLGENMTAEIIFVQPVPDNHDAARARAVEPRHHLGVKRFIGPLNLGQVRGMVDLEHVVANN